MGALRAIKRCQRCNKENYSASIRCDICNEFHNRDSKRRRDSNPEKLRLIERKSQLKTKFGMTLEDEIKLLEEQDYGCAICKVKQSISGQRFLCVDHDHECCPGVKSCGVCARIALSYMQ